MYVYVSVYICLENGRSVGIDVLFRLNDKLNEWKQFLFTQLNFMVNQAPSLHIQKSTETTRFSLNSSLIRSVTFLTPQVSTQNQRQVNKNSSQTH